MGYVYRKLISNFSWYLVYAIARKKNHINNDQPTADVVFHKYQHDFTKYNGTEQAIIEV